MVRMAISLTRACHSPGHLFTGYSDNELASLKKLGLRWKQYLDEGKLVYEQHPFWISVRRAFPCRSLSSQAERRVNLK